ncbi:MAG TPA: methyltransferase domain-containing protein [Opitutaceae bacterium]|jgi:ubiquinone/menaquinone biosynthesis C-methylase UbiE
MSDEAHERWQGTTTALGGRSDYKRVWDRQAAEYDVASLAVGGFIGEDTLERRAEATIETLRAIVGIRPNDVILEIGCGIARVGKPLSHLCLHWVGADISGEMLKHARRRLEGCGNTTLVELATVGLQELPSDSFDLVYCTIVFMHLFEWDRYRYVQEAFRVLTPGGRAYFDNFPLDSDHGWQIFTQGAQYTLGRRPAHLSMSSSREELRTYLSRAGFERIRIDDLPNGLISVSGHKAAAA